MAILEDFDNRYEIFILYQSCSERLAQSEKKVLQAFKEKVEIENSKNQIMLGMQKAGHTYREVLFIKKQNDKYGDLGDDNFRMRGDTIRKTSVVSNQKDEFKLIINPKTDVKSFSKLQWAQSISREIQRIEKKNQEIEEEEKNRVKVKNQKDRFSYQLKHLYTNLLAHPEVAYKRGLYLEDIIVFLMSLEFKLNYQDISQIFLDEEKEYLLNVSEISYGFLSNKDKLNDWCWNFSLRQKDQRKRNATKKTKTKSFQLESISKSYVEKPNVHQIVKNLQKKSEQRIEGLVETLIQNNIREIKPIKVFDKT